MDKLKSKIFMQLNNSVVCAEKEFLLRKEIEDETLKMIYNHAKSLNILIRLCKQYKKRV